MPITSALPTEFFGWADLITGLSIGAYNPIQKRWRNNDCRSQFFNLATNLTGYAKHFDKPFEVAGGPIFWFVFQLTFTGLATNNMWKVCTEQLEGSDAWVDNFIPQEESNLELEDVAKPQLLAFEGVPDYLAAA